MLVFLPSCHLSFKFRYIMSAGRNTAETSAKAASNDIEKQRIYVLVVEAVRHQRSLKEESSERYGLA